MAVGVEHPRPLAQGIAGVLRVEAVLVRGRHAFAQAVDVRAQGGRLPDGVEPADDGVALLAERPDGLGGGLDLGRGDARHPATVSVRAAPVHGRRWRRHVHA